MNAASSVHQRFESILALYVFITNAVFLTVLFELVSQLSLSMRESTGTFSYKKLHWTGSHHVCSLLIPINGPI